MKPIQPKTSQEKAVQITGGLAITVVGILIGGVFALLGIIVGLSIAGNAAFAKSKK